MATKTREEVHISPNGNGTAPESSTIRLSAFQKRYMQRLVGNFERAKASVEQAQNAANEFIVACGEEMNIQVGADGWTFDIDAFEFIRVPQGGVTNGDDS